MEQYSSFGTIAVCNYLTANVNWGLMKLPMVKANLPLSCLADSGDMLRPG